jgi:tRNA (cmo5U34)-methyltransferase
MGAGEKIEFDAARAARYQERWARLAPLNRAIHLIAVAALAELPEGSWVLCVGAGTGAELGALAGQHPSWRFTAVDPSGPMLEICRARMAEQGVADRCTFHEGTLESLPEAEPFDAATSLLVSHFLVDRAQRVSFFRQIRERLKPGAPLLTADLSAPGVGGPLADAWTSLLVYAGLEAEEIAAYLDRLGKQVALLPSREVEDIVTEGGFEQVTRVYQAVWMCAWLARAALR